MSQTNEESFQNRPPFIMNESEKVWSNHQVRKNIMNENFKNETDPSPESGDTGRQFETLSDAIKAGTSEGAAKAREKAPELKTGVVDAVHDLAYGLAYGSVFAGAFINELIPKAVREGLYKGAEAGKAAGAKACEQVQETLSPDAKHAGESDNTNPSFS